MRLRRPPACVSSPECNNFRAPTKVGPTVFSLNSAIPKIGVVRMIRPALIVLAMVATLVVPAGVAGAQGVDETSGPSITFSGGGYGHGVGMSQYGARGRADAGQTYQQILAHYYEGTSVGQTNFSGPIEVLVATTATPGFVPEGPVKVWMGDRVMAEATSGQRIDITHSKTGFTVEVAGQIVCQPAVCNGAEVRVQGAADGTPIKLEQSGHRYQYGDLRLKPVPGGGTMYVVVGGLTLDRYLLGLGEVPASWPTQALKAQAVAGRTFAVRTTTDRRARSSWTRPYDVSATDGDQVYNGMKQETGPSGHRWVDAVNQTAGEVSLFNNQPILSFFSSSNGGYSARSDYVFVATLPYLSARPDPFDDTPSNARGQWERTYDLDLLSRWMQRKGETAVGTISNVTISGNVGQSGRIDRATVTLTGSSGTKSVSGNAFRQAVNAAAVADGKSAINDGFPSTLVSLGSITGPTNDHTPIGKFKVAAVDGSANTATLRGWALDLDTEDSILVRIRQNGQQIATVTARGNRPAIARKHGAGPNHGIDATIDLVAGPNEICLEALDSTSGAPASPIGCRTVSSASSPTGSLDAIRVEPGPTIVVTGSATDADTNKALAVHVYVDGKYAAGGATNAAANTFSLPVQATEGVHEVCAHALDDSGAARNKKLGCTSVEVRSPSQVDPPSSDRQPVGAVTSASVSGTVITTRGWAIDPDSSDNIEIVVNVNGSRAFVLMANDTRPNFGDEHGFVFDVNGGTGTFNICVVARNADDGKNTPFGCRSHTV